jgi:hypothetical protein
MANSRSVTCSGIATWARGLLVGSALALTAAAPALGPAEALPSYDGLWSVVIITRAGLCEPSYRYPVRIANGHIINAGKSQVHVSGRVGKNGAVVVNVSQGDKTAIGTGRLAATSGGGSWSGGNGVCSGVWQAERRS